MPLVAGVDSSTQSTYVELREGESGRLVGSGRVRHPATVPPCSEQDPATWWSALVGAMAMALVSAAGQGFKPEDVAAMAVAGQQHGLVVLDGNDEVIRPAKLWNDTQSGEDAEALIDVLGAARWARACGSVPVAAFTITKLAWLRRSEREHFARIAHVLLPHDWLTYRLTGVFVTDRGEASGTGYWSPRADAYRFDLLGLVDDGMNWPDMLPEVRGPWSEAGGLTTPAARELGLEAGTRVAVGTGDNMAGALGVGLATGDTAISIGTSGTVFAVADHGTCDPSGAVAGFADATGRFLPLVCTLNAAQVTSAVGDLLSVDHAGLDDLALAAPAGSGGLILLPYLAGERTPNRPNATGSLLGIRPDVSRQQLARAAFEGVACSLLDGLDALAAAGVETEAGRLMLLGGGARSAACRRVMADLAGRSITIPSEEEAVAMGAAFQAAVLVSGEPAIDALVTAWDLGAGQIVDPGPESAGSKDLRRRFALAKGRDVV